MSDGLRLTFSVAGSLVAHAALVVLAPLQRETAPRLRARKGPVSVVIRRRPSRAVRRPTAAAPLRPVRPTPEKKAARLAGPAREPVPPAAAPAREPMPVPEEVERLQREPVRPELSEEAPPVRVESGVKRAVLPGKAVPEYPACCRSGSCNRGTPREDCVRAKVGILSDGRTAGITLIESAGCARMNRSVEKFFRRARFAPATRWGKAVASVRTYTVRFRLEDE